jgi:tetratricopeptide (TPR) repeat protein
MELEQGLTKYRKNKNLDVALNRALEDIQTREGNEMKLSSIRSGFAILTLALVAALGEAPALHAQYGSSAPPPQQQPAPSLQQQTPAKPVVQQAPVAPADPEEDKSYKAFTDAVAKTDAYDQQIQTGEQYLQKYPAGHYTEQVYARLVNAYLQKQQLDKMYAAGDKALSLNPDDVSVLVLVGWVIPHYYDPNDIEAERRLAKAEAYEKHALDLLAKLPKPDGVSDEQFAKSKKGALEQAHSGLGLVYFRQQDIANAVTEMQSAIQIDPTADPVDYYILGVGLNHLKRYSEAADAFQKCSQMPGPVQDRCTKGLADAKKQAAATPAPAK